ncbi:amidase family protein [Thalassobaculum sp.]|uniref:amidase n=1 Tax=Thalassobaculum sp. TaxID=2022740 RepID=UPI0032EC6830
MARGEELTRLTAREAVRLLAAGEVSPLELIDAAAARIAAVEPAINALPTLCLERARNAAKKLPATRPDGGRGWLAGLPVAIKDLMDVEGVRTTYGSPIHADHVPAASHPLVGRIEARGGVVIAKSNTPEFGAGGNTYNEVFGKTRNPWNTALTPGGSTGGGAAALAAGEVWLAHGSDHGGSLRGPAAHCSVVGLRPTPGRVTRGTASNLFSPSSVEGPMARNVPDIALFLDTMAGECVHDPLTRPAPARGYADTVDAALAEAKAWWPKRVAWTPDLGGSAPVSKAVRAVCEAAVRRLQGAGVPVEEACPEMGGIGEAFQILRAMIFVVSHGERLKTHRHLIKPDIIWNTEKGLKQTPEQVAWAERERAAFYRRVVTFFETYDLLLLPTSVVPPYDVNKTHIDEVDGVKFDNYIAASMTTSSITLSACPAISIPAGFTEDGRPVGLQLVGRPHDEAGLLAAAALIEELTGLAKLLPIDPRAGTA